MKSQQARLAAAATVLAGTVVVVVLLASGWLPVTSHRPQQVSSGPVCRVLASPRAAPASRPGTGRIISHLGRPAALAIGPRGQLYLADDGLDRILQVLPGGRFRVVAGNGRRGYAGDGGPAVAASLNDPGGLAVTPNGTIYVADTGNNRVRAVSAAGTITTVAGTGRYGAWAPGGSAPLGTSLGGPADVAVSPGGCLYIADQGTSEILRLDASGRLVRVAGSRGAAGRGVPGDVAATAPADGPDGLAFGKTGGLYVAGASTKTLLMITAGGLLRLPDGPDGFYPRGAGGLAAGPGGIVAMNGQRVQRITGQGLRTLLDFSRVHPAGIRGFLPNGIAAGPNGTIYLDTYAGNGYTAKTALIETQPGGRFRVLWQS